MISVDSAILQFLNAGQARNRALRVVIPTALFF